eukprot:TRINITY_DN4627_c0_g1_i1.p1 TRINITY_DN4627_c0_g1~~TRINITY_DN4627_c0_g1_i1.p1  ORF type:complete len:1122 (-),score=370.58 TRINITY_DN4627_c0_g1_i1:3-3107(-)
MKGSLLWRDYWVVLQGDRIDCYSHRKLQNRAKPFSIPLNNKVSIVEAAFQDTKKENTFRLSFSKKKVLISCNSRELCDHWIAAIRAILFLNEEPRKTERSGSIAARGSVLVGEVGISETIKLKSQVKGLLLHIARVNERYADRLTLQSWRELNQLGGATIQVGIAMRALSVTPFNQIARFQLQDTLQVVSKMLSDYKHRCVFPMDATEEVVQIKSSIDTIVHHLVQKNNEKIPEEKVPAPMEPLAAMNLSRSRTESEESEGSETLQEELISVIKILVLATKDLISRNREVDRDVKQVTTHAITIIVESLKQLKTIVHDISNFTSYNQALRLAFSELKDAMTKVVVIAKDLVNRHEEAKEGQLLGIISTKVPVLVQRLVSQAKLANEHVIAEEQLANANKILQLEIKSLSDSINNGNILANEPALLQNLIETSNQIVFLLAQLVQIVNDESKTELHRAVKDIGHKIASLGELTQIVATLELEGPSNARFQKRAQMLSAEQEMRSQAIQLIGWAKNIIANGFNKANLAESPGKSAVSYSPNSPNSPLSPPISPRGSPTSTIRSDKIEMRLSPSLEMAATCTVLAAYTTRSVSALRIYMAPLWQEDVHHATEEVVSNWDEPDDENYIVKEVSENGSVRIRAATLDKLIVQLTCTQLDMKFQRTFLLTYRSFTTPEIFLTKLEQRFNMKVPKLPNKVSTAEYFTSTIQPIQLRVIGVLKSWIESSFEDFDYVVMRKLEGFIKTLEAEKHDRSAAIIKHTIQRQVSEKASIEITSNPTKVMFQMPNVTSMSLLQILLQNSEEDIAKHLTAIDSKTFNSIKTVEVLNQAWNKERLKYRAPNVLKMVEQFNSLSSWAASAIIWPEKLKNRVAMYIKLIEIAEHCRKLKNFNSMLGIAAGLNSSAVFRLKITFGELPEKSRKAFDNIMMLMSNKKAYKDYREALRSIEPPCVPYIGVFLTDLTFAEEGNKDTQAGLINFRKRELVSEIIENSIRLHQQSRYTFNLNDTLTLALSQLPFFDNEQLYQISLLREPRNAQRSELE